jgi:hypothetical protein
MSIAIPRHSTRRSPPCSTEGPIGRALLGSRQAANEAFEERTRDELTIGRAGRSSATGALPRDAASGYRRNPDAQPARRSALVDHDPGRRPGRPTRRDSSRPERRSAARRDRRMAPGRDLRRTARPRPRSPDAGWRDRDRPSSSCPPHPDRSLRRRAGRRHGHDRARRPGLSHVRGEPARPDGRRARDHVGEAGHAAAGRRGPRRHCAGERVCGRCGRLARDG